MEDERLCEIKIRIHEEDDLYNPLDPDRELISDDVVDYVERKYSEDFDPLDRIVITVISDVPLEEERVRENFRHYMQDEQEILSKEQHRTAVKQAWLFLVGIIFIAVWLVFAVNTDNVFIEVLSIIGSVAMWEAADIWIVEAPETRIRKRRLQRLEDTEIRFARTREES